MRPPPAQGIDQCVDPELILDVYWTSFCRRRRGLALEAVQLVMAYASARLCTSKVRAKIGVANAASIGLFHKLVRTSLCHHRMCCWGCIRDV